MSLERLNQQRVEKLEKLRAAGIEPYPNSFQRSATAQEAVALLEKVEAGGHAEMPEVTVGGRIMGRRKMGKIGFLDLRDSSGKIQLLLGDKLNPAHNELLENIDIGDIIGVTGRLFRTRTKEPTIAVAEVTLLSKSLQPLPEKWHGLSDVEVRYRQRYLDLISSPNVQRTFAARSQIIAGVRQFLNKRGFLEVETPVLQPSAGGALARPFVTHHHALGQDFFLRIALELHLKRLTVGGFDKVYEIGRIFRNEGISTDHNPEFTMLESYEAYADYNDVMKMVEEMIFEVAQTVLGTANIKYGADEIDLTPPWPRVTLRDAIKKYTGIDFVEFPSAADLRDKMRSMKIDAPADKNWAKLVDELLKSIRPKLIQPVFIYDYPVSMSPLAKNKFGEERVVERFQPYIGGLELGNAYSELNDPLLQRQRFEEQMKERVGEDKERWSIDEDFLTALEYGMPPTGGLGIGIDRLVMLLTNQQSIREVILFPQLRDK